MKDESKNLILATVLSFLVILVWFVLFPPEEPPQTAGTDGTSSAGATMDGGVATAPPVAADGGLAALDARTAAIEDSPRIDIRTPSLSGSLSLTGGRIDDLRLDNYDETLDEESEPVTLLSPAGSPDAYYALHGWIPSAALGYDAVPNAWTEWELESGEVLTPETPVTLRWDNGSGLIFRKVISVDDNYMFDIAQSVENTTGETIRLAPYGIIARHGEPETIGFYILHEGVVRFHDGELNEIDYSDMPDLDFDPRENGAVEIVGVEENGWIGFTDMYWMTALVPQPGAAFTSVVKYTPSSDTYQTETRMPAIDVAPGATGEYSTALFAGAKLEERLAEYEEDRGIVQFVDSIDWGWFFFFTKPIHWALVGLDGMVGNMGVAIILLTLIIKLILLPLAWKSYSAMAKMKALQPEMEKIKERAGDDRQKLQTEMMELYKKEKVNPASGCLPILVQIPIFFSLYKVIFVSIEIRHAPFFGWIRDLSAPDPTSLWNLFGVLPYDVSFIPPFLALGVWPILLGISMWLQQKLNPAPTDPTQAAIFAWLPWVFMFMLGSFASGLVIYWVANNTITFIQQYSIMRAQGVEVDVLGNIKKGFKRKKRPAE
ncbi:MAG: membrane protein insertase YidC [Rubricella sp.]